MIGIYPSLHSGRIIHQSTDQSQYIRNGQDIGQNLHHGKSWHGRQTFPNNGYQSNISKQGRSYISYPPVQDSIISQTNSDSILDGEDEKTEYRDDDQRDKDLYHIDDHIFVDWHIYYHIIPFYKLEGVDFVDFFIGIHYFLEVMIITISY